MHKQQQMLNIQQINPAQAFRRSRHDASESKLRLLVNLFAATPSMLRHNTTFLRIAIFETFGL